MYLHDRVPFASPIIMPGPKPNLNGKSVAPDFRACPPAASDEKGDMSRRARWGSPTLLLRKQPPRVAMRNLLRHRRRQLRQPSAIAGHDLAIARPTLGDPGIRAEQEAVGIALEQA